MTPCAQGRCATRLRYAPTVWIQERENQASSLIIKDAYLDARRQLCPLRHIIQNVSEPLQYAIVAYVQNPVAEFVEHLRRELYPQHGHLPAHLTVLPPRTLRGTEAASRETMENICATVEPFEISLGDVEAFFPATPTVFIRVDYGAYRMRELHDRLNTAELWAAEQWPYMPHLTIVKMADLEDAVATLQRARQRWSHYHGPRRLLVDRLTFVRESREQLQWIDLAPIPLGGRLAPSALR